MNFILNKLLTGLINLFFPKLPKCPACQQEFSPQQINLCQDCISKIDFIKEDYCLKCGKQTSKKQQFCFDCQERDYKYLFEQARAVGVYSRGLKEYIKLFKYHNYRDLSSPLGDLMTIYIERFYNIEEIDLITYIPIHSKRLAKRGFNQAYLLAKRLHKNLKLPLKSILIRNEFTVKQSKLSRQERLKNLKHKFSIETPQIIKDKRILMVDDIYTTGATVNEASQVLIANDAEVVEVITLATGSDLTIRQEFH